MTASVIAIVCTVATIAGILFRPWRVPEWGWAVGGAIAVVALRVSSPAAAWAAVADGLDVYLFLIGIMLLASLADRHEIFAWLAKAALRSSSGSRGRLFGLLYAVGVGVTALLSNDTAAVVLTPAVIAVLARTNAPKMPYLYACAFVSAAASFLLPIGNPANLVVFDGRLPPLGAWLSFFALAAVGAILVTFIMLRLLLRRDLDGSFALVGVDPHLTSAGRVAAWSVGLAAVALVAVNALGGPIGLTALVAGVAAVAVSAVRDPGGPFNVVRRTSWMVLPLVAGLFVVISALGAGGWSAPASRGLSWLAALPGPSGHLAVAGTVAVAANVFNNLPVALFVRSAVGASSISPTLLHAVLVAVDLGPTLLVTGSLATLLWLITLRRAGFSITPLQFLRLGLGVTIPALVGAVLLVR